MRNRCRILVAVALLVAVLVGAGCTTLAPTQTPTVCAGPTPVPFLHLRSESALAIPPGNGSTYEVLGPDQVTVTKGTNGTAESIRLSGSRHPCEALIEDGIYPLADPVGYRFLVSSDPGPFSVLSGCTGVLMTPTNSSTPAPAYVATPINGTGDNLRVLHGDTWKPVPRAVIEAHATRTLSISTTHCGGQTVDWLDVQNLGKVTVTYAGSS